jgi:hypothetical protein
LFFVRKFSSETISQNRLQVFYTFLAATFRLANLHNPYFMLENFGSMVVFGANPASDPSKSAPDNTKKTN